MRVLAASLALSACLVGGCGGEVDGELAATPRATVATPVSLTKPAPPPATADDAVGAWTFDVDGFVEENWARLMSTAEPGIAAIRDANERIEALPEAQREEAMRRVRAALSPSDLAIHDAVMGGEDALRSWAKNALREQLGSSRFDVTLAKDGSCSLSFDLHGYRSEAQGTWTRDGDGVTVRLTTVDGKPAKAKDRAPRTLALREDRLLLPFAPGGPTLVARRRV